jgi:hypothetical protein
MTNSSTDTPATGTPAEPIRAHRGDLLIVHVRHSDYVIGRGAQNSDAFRVGVVTTSPATGR